MSHVTFYIQGMLLEGASNKMVRPQTHALDPCLGPGHPGEGLRREAWAGTKTYRELMRGVNILNVTFLMS